MEEFMLPCLTKKFLGFECPGCGGQRAFVLLINGEFSDAFFMYPAIYPLLMLGFVVIGNFFFSVKNYSQVVSVLAIISVATILVNYLLKFVG